MEAATQTATPAAMIVTLDGEPVIATSDETLWQIAARKGIDIPHLCWQPQPKIHSGSACRLCVVEVAGERTLTPSCSRRAEPGMVVFTASARVLAARRMILHLLLAATPTPTTQGQGAAGPAPPDRLRLWAARLEVRSPSPLLLPQQSPASAGTPVAGAAPPEPMPQVPACQPAGSPEKETDSEAGFRPAIHLDPQACIVCGACVRACQSFQANGVLGLAGRGTGSRVVFDADQPLAASSCVGCGACVDVCPTLALRPRVSELAPEREASVVCPYCGVGCRVTLHIRRTAEGTERIVGARGGEGPANQSRLCVKGRFGFAYLHSPERLTVPLVRRPDAPKRADERIDPANPFTHFRPASWDEALDLAAAGFQEIRRRHSPAALAGFGSAKGSNEEAYLFQKLIRTGFGTNNVDHCTRLCHASSVAALMEGLGSAAVSVPVADVLKADVIMVIGANPCVNHPVAASFIKTAARQGATLIVADPRGQGLDPYARHRLRFRPGTDAALLNGLLAVILEENLIDRDFIARQTRDFERLATHVRTFVPAVMAALCGVSEATLRTVARAYATARASMIIWGMGVSQHVHGTDNVRALIALALVTGQIGRPGAGLHPIRGQNNVQGASDAGLIPMVYPGYQSVTDPAAQARFEALWGQPLDPHRGLTVVEILDAAYHGRLKGLYVMGENPAMSDPDLTHARAGLARLDWLVVQDLFLTETAVYADVVLPASALPEKTGTFTNTDRCVQLSRKALPCPGEAREDWRIIQDLARRLGLDWNYPNPAAIYAELRQVWPALAGIPWSRLERDGSAIHPCPDERHPGTPVLFAEGFPMPGGRGRLVPAAVAPPDELPDEAYPMILTTGRILEHWHTGAMTRRAPVLDALEPEPVVHLAEADLQRLGLGAGDPVTVETRRGAITLTARADRDVAPGLIFIPFCFHEAPANRLTNPTLDPFGKIPEFKFCAARLRPAAVAEESAGSPQQDRP